LFERPQKKVTYSGGIIGVDVGLIHFATTSEGVKIENPRHLQKSLRRLKHLQRNLSRKQVGSKSWEKARRRVAKRHEQIRNQRADFLHRLSYQWTNENQVVRLETLNIQGMMQNRHLAQAIGSAGWGELKQQLVYKGKWYGCQIEYVPMFFPSTKLCHTCQEKNPNLTLADREWQCPHCGAIHDRDINAALNIRDYDSYPTVGSTGIDAGGGGKVHHLSDGQVPPMKPEATTF
jgi:putative transposase